MQLTQNLYRKIFTETGWKNLNCILTKCGTHSTMSFFKEKIGGFRLELLYFDTEIISPGIILHRRKNDKSQRK